MAAKRRNAKRRAPTFREQLQARFDAVASQGRRITVLVAAVVLVGLGMKGLSALTALPVERIVVGGKLEGLQQEALREALAVHLNEGLLRLNLRELRGENFVCGAWEAYAKGEKFAEVERDLTAAFGDAEQVEGMARAS